MRLVGPQQEMKNELTGKQAVSCFGKSGRKAPGTRIGILNDWREGSKKSGKRSGRYGRALRDGR